MDNLQTSSKLHEEYEKVEEKITQGEWVHAEELYAFSTFTSGAFSFNEDKGTSIHSHDGWMHIMIFEIKKKNDEPYGKLLESSKVPEQYFTDIELAMKDARNKARKMGK